MADSELTHAHTHTHTHTHTHICVLFYVFLCCSMYCLFCDVLCIVCVYMCTVLYCAALLPPGGYPIAVKYIISSGV